jgi:hypothetical protein
LSAAIHSSGELYFSKTGPPRRILDWTVELAARPVGMTDNAAIPEADNDKKFRRFIFGVFKYQKGNKK